MKRICSVLAVLVCLCMQWACTGTNRTGMDNVQGLESHGQEVVKISPEQLQAMLSDPDLLIIDLRTPRDWQQSTEKIPGAVRHDPQAVESWAQDLDTRKRVVTYCA